MMRSNFAGSRRVTALKRFGPALSLAWAVAGCGDSIHFTEQIARVSVVEHESRRPASNVQIEWERMYYDGWMTHLNKTERDELWLERSMNKPRTTDETGTASLPTVTGTIRGGLFPEPFDPHQDRLRNEPYLFHLRRDGKSEMLNVTITPGHESSGQMFDVNIISIGPARDITQEYARGQYTPEAKE